MTSPSPVLAATTETTSCRATLVKDRRTRLVDCSVCGLHGRIYEHLPYSRALADGLSSDDAYEVARRDRSHVERMLRTGVHTEAVVNGPTARQRAAAARTAGMDPLFELPAPPPPPPPPVAAPGVVDAAEATATAGPTIPAPRSAEKLPRVVGDQRLPHPNPHGCLHCANRATLLLTLVTGFQVATCRPHASRYPR